jgi:NAD(P)H-flavin reductase
VKLRQSPETMRHRNLYIAPILQTSLAEMPRRSSGGSAGQREPSAVPPFNQRETLCDYAPWAILMNKRMGGRRAHRQAACAASIIATLLHPHQCAAFCAGPPRAPQLHRSYVPGGSRCAVSSLRMGDAPNIHFCEAEVVSNTNVADLPGSRLLRIKAADKSNAQYSPGHVLALRIPNVTPQVIEGKHGDGTTAPYTITSCNQATGVFDILYRVIEGGRVTSHLNKLKRSSPILFGGKFKVPVAEGINPAAEHVLCLSTGVGIGPVYGFAKQELASTERSVSIYGGFRDVRDIALQEELQDLVQQYPQRLEFMPCISSLRDERYPAPMGFEGLRGRVTDVVPMLLDAHVLASGRVHVHLIGNGGMVNQMKAALLQVGLPPEALTQEIYFNHKETPSATEIAQVVAALEAPPVTPATTWAGAET